MAAQGQFKWLLVKDTNIVQVADLTMDTITLFIGAGFTWVDSTDATNFGLIKQWITCDQTVNKQDVLYKLFYKMCCGHYYHLHCSQLNAQASVKTLNDKMIVSSIVSSITSSILSHLSDTNVSRLSDTNVSPITSPTMTPTEYMGKVADMFILADNLKTTT